MGYSITGLVIRSSEEDAAKEHGWPFVRLNQDVTLLPLTNEHVLLTDGDETEGRADFEFVAPDWLSEMAGCFSASAYIEADIWGGDGMQASIAFEEDGRVSEALISRLAINFSLRRLGIQDEEAKSSLFGLPIPVGTEKDPFDMVGLGRFRSVEGWLTV